MSTPWYLAVIWHYPDIWQQERVFGQVTCMESDGSERNSQKVLGLMRYGCGGGPGALGGVLQSQTVDPGDMSHIIGMTYVLGSFLGH